MGYEICWEHRDKFVIIQWNYFGKWSVIKNKNEKSKLRNGNAIRHDLFTRTFIKVINKFDTIYY